MKRFNIRWTIEKCQGWLDINHPGSNCVDTVYVNNRIKMNIRCEKGHIWPSRWDDISGKKCWCPHCAGMAKPSSEYIINYLVEHHPGSVWSDPTEYKNRCTKLHIICEHGHNITPTWGSIRSKQWCSYCAGNTKTASEYIINYLNGHHSGSIWLDHSEYKNCCTKLHIICEKGHDFDMRWNHIQRGHWCPHCLYKHQTICKKILEKVLNVKLVKLTGHYIDIFSGKERSMHFDGYDKKYNIAFEYNGEQHYNFHHFHQGNIQKLNNQIQRDIEAWKYCIKKDIILIVIPYWIEDNNLKQYIKDKLINAEII